LSEKNRFSSLFALIAKGRRVKWFYRLKKVKKNNDQKWQNVQIQTFKIFSIEYNFAYTYLYDGEAQCSLLPHVDIYDCSAHQN
jgi:hypothetical protein